MPLYDPNKRCITGHCPDNAYFYHYFSPNRHILSPGDLFMKVKHWKTYLFWILLAEGVGGLSGFLTRDGVARYEAMVQKPPLTPPGWVFPVVWGILFALMGIGAARVYLTPASDARSRGLKLFFLQLWVNFLWSIFFFNGQLYLFSFLWILGLWGLILLMITAFRPLDRWAAVMQIPYLLWVTFAAYLTFGVWRLNG